MSLAAGTRLGPYEIVALVGAGGMGEVYRAQDTRLERTVAVKVLSSQLSSSPELRQRFEREAKTISKLSHPHICALYDVGQADGTEFLVMEYLEGETLTQRLARGPLPPDQVLRYGIEMAQALDQAHRHGIVHRDLKPGNVMVSKSGVKLLDFGLAKAFERPLDAAEREQAAAGQHPMAKQGLTALPTLAGSPDLTAQGTILGTFQYMSPEQLEGREADSRSDIFALGAVLYEMATGKKAFAGKTQASLIGAILKDEPAAISTVQPMAPPALDRVVRICLSKDPEDRWQSAHDIAAELQWIAEGSQAGVAAPAAVVGRRRSRERIAWAGLAVAVLAAAAFAVAYSRRAPAAARVLRFQIDPSESTPYKGVGPGDDLLPALSPDGTLMVFPALNAQGKTLLWVRPLDTLDARAIPGTEEGLYPFWSPDSRSIGFFAQKKLKRVDVAGGAVQAICDAADGRGGTWSREGVILFAPGAETPLHRVSSSGGQPSAVLSFDSKRGEDSQRWPLFLPDGRHFLYFSYVGANPETKNQNGGIRAGALDSKETTEVVSDGASNVVYVEPGELVFYRGGNLLAQRFDPSSLKTSGEPVPVAESVAYIEARKFALFSASSTGILVYARATAFPSRLTWLDRDGKPLGTVGESGDYGSPALSPDGRRLLVIVAEGVNTTIWLYDLSRGTKTRFSQGTGDGPAVWAPDGNRVAFGSARGGPARLFVRTVGGEGSEQAMLKTTNAEIPSSWSRDGRFLAYMVPGQTTDWDVWILPLTGDRKPFPYLQTNAREVTPVFSPDGRWIAYCSNDSGKLDVYVAPFPGPGQAVPISTAGGREPTWSGDGKEIFFIADDGKMMAVPIRESGATLEPGVPVALFDTRTRQSLLGRYDVTPDGKKFLVVTRTVDREIPPIVVVVNWLAGLKK